jgi:hypothetical protein
MALGAERLAVDFDRSAFVEMFVRNTKPALLAVDNFHTSSGLSKPWLKTLRCGESENTRSSTL